MPDDRVVDLAALHALGMDARVMRLQDSNGRGTSGIRLPPYADTRAYVAEILGMLGGAGDIAAPTFEVRLVA